MRIAVIGSGIAGLGAAWALSQRHDVTVYEKDKRPGGHSHTVDVEANGRSIPVDTGFIVYNGVNYPNLTRLFEALGVATIESNMSFAVSLGDGALEWAGDNVFKLFAQKRNIFRPSFHAMWSGILRFNREARADSASGALDGLTLGEYLDAKGYGRSFRDQYLLPMGAAIWSTPAPEMLAFPAKSFVQFFDNHALLNGFATTPWRTVAGGSRSYVTKLIAAIKGKVLLGCGAARVSRDGDGVTIMDSDGGSQRFDQVVFACHSDEAMALIEAPAAAERALVGAVRYAPNTAYLHRDVRLMPKRRLVWSSWNYLSAEKPGRGAGPGPVSVSYWMNRLQKIDPAVPLFVSLNPIVDPDPALVYRTFTYDHPQFDRAALGAQERLHEIQGQNRTWFCGAWTGHGFHEDGLKSGLEVAAHLGAPAPWGNQGHARIWRSPEAVAAE